MRLHEPPGSDVPRGQQGYQQAEVRNVPPTRRESRSYESEMTYTPRTISAHAAYCRGSHA